MAVGPASVVIGISRMDDLARRHQQISPANQAEKAGDKPGGDGHGKAARRLDACSIAAVVGLACS
jgi:hypothetical protein